METTDIKGHLVLVTGAASGIGNGGYIGASLGVDHMPATF